MTTKGTAASSIAHPDEMRLFQLLQLKLPALNITDCKIHLAGWNGIESPLDVFLKGEFQQWQEWQTKRNFERPWIVSLIQLQQQHQWLFAGCYWQKGATFVAVSRLWRYTTTAFSETEDFTGRLIVRFERDGRQPYRRAEGSADGMFVHSLLPERITVEAFPGFRWVRISKARLDLIVARQIESWKTALSSVGGVYLITDTKTGRHYVGSAYGVGGIWQRWCEYSAGAHGGNRRLEAVMQQHGADYCSHFQFSILETADTNASESDVLGRETHWKNVLCSRQSHGGYNAN